jgi:hypothetical protein
MKHQKKTTVILFILWAFFLAACDDGNSGSLTSVDNSKKIEDLSEEDLQQMCEDYTAALANAMDQEFFCTMGGIAAAEELGGSEMACETTYDMCIDMDLEIDIEQFFSCEDMLEDVGDIDDSDDTDGASDTGDCDATVGDADACIQDMLAALEDIADSLSCANSASGDLEDILDMEEPASCEALEDKCPDMDDIEIPF